ncbi:GntR family transcriptional regulator [Cloacibacillus evryensis]|uniref:GntR family transcriptional regulator n=1 Tax=Cloacibacillus evryensis TaxID=508460 RepID=A0AAW5K499_9BACT|nr:GntR family transcriptional regulator [Cloacibacillus evryensis]MCQ4762508.1 GntR family transcriptional regulator [Cloacibacillus evryensis]MCQ4814576.1 GntR family transcriptional regulator [Cloacibacillus evryensis]MEA5034502.1 GntR family transcriptional regulator [Cloacibacillus evryensis]
MMQPIVKVPTLSELAYESIKAQILSCKIRPGERINIDQYSENLGVSTTPVREALSKLQQEGLVQYIPRTGWKISRISKQEFRKLQEVKSLLEITLAERALPFIKPNDIPQMILLNNEMRELFKPCAGGKPDLERLLEANDRFHMYIFKFYDNDIMIEILQQTWNNLRYARLIWISSEEFLNNFYEEHNEIIAAIKDRNGAALRDAVEKHLRCGLGYMEACLEDK